MVPRQGARQGRQPYQDPPERSGRSLRRARLPLRLQGRFLATGRSLRGQRRVLGLYHEAQGSLGDLRLR